jgi:hypothetical protein
VFRASVKADLANHVTVRLATGRWTGKIARQPADTAAGCTPAEPLTVDISRL